jgi:hypothetical protein
VWTGQSPSRRKILPTAREIGARNSQRRSSGQEADPPSSLRCRAPFQSETALPEANKFSSRVPTVLQHWGKLSYDCSRAGAAGWDGSQIPPLYSGPTRPGLTGRTWLRTLEQSPESRRYGSDPRNLQRGPRRLPPRHRACQGFVRASVFHRASDPAGRRCQMQRGESRGKGQADLSAEQPAPSPRARLPAADAHPGGTRHRVRPASQRPPLADRVIPIPV